MAHDKFGEFMMYTLISIISLFSLLLFVPHTLLSSSSDTPLIFYRYLMILAGLLLFLYNIIINFNGIDDDVSHGIKLLCQFIDWIYIVIVIPLVIPFVNNIIKAAQTASHISIYKFNVNKLSLVPQHSDKDNIETKKNRYSQILISFLTFLIWFSVIICQILSWYNNDPFYKKVLFQYIISSYICFVCLFVAINFILLYREFNKVQKTFIKVQTKYTRSSSDPSHNYKNHKNDNSVSIHVPQSVLNKNAEANQEVIQSLEKHKKKCVKITTFVIILAALNLYPLIMKRETPILNIPYSEYPLFNKPYIYILWVLTRLVFTMIMYLWLAINNLYKKKVPKDSIGYLIYSQFCSLCINKNDNCNIQEIEMEHIPKIIQFKDDINYIKKHQQLHEIENSNKSTLPNSMPNMQATSTDEYADIDNITMFKPENQIQIENDLKHLPKMAINIIKDSKENNFDDSNNKNSFETKTKSSKYLHKSHASINTMTLPANNSPVTKTIATVFSSVGNDEFSALPTYKEEFHRDNGLMESGTNNSIDNGSQFFSPSPNSFRFPDILRKVTGPGTDILPNMKINSSNPNSDIYNENVESDSEDCENQMIVGIKVIIYSFDILLGKLDTISHENLDKYETKIKRLLQHFLIMNDNIENVYCLSNKLKNENMIEELEKIHLNNSFDGENKLIGCDNKWISNCNKNIKLILLQLIQKLGIENDELLFVGNRKVMQYIETLNICQIYNVDAIETDKNNQKEAIDGTLQGRHLMFLESQVLASI